MQQKATEIRKGQILRFNGKIVRVTSAKHITPGKGVACMQVSMKDIQSSSNINQRFRSDDKIEIVEVRNKKMQYLYQDADQYVFMDPENFEQLFLSESVVSDALPYLLANSEVEVSFVDEKPTSLILPQRVTLKVTDTDPAMNNASSSNVMKPATLETGLVVQVPPFINKDEAVVITTETGEYFGRG